MIEGDVLDFDSLRRAMEECDIVVHCAEIACVVEWRDGRLRTRRYWEVPSPTEVGPGFEARGLLNTRPILRELDRSVPARAAMVHG